MWRKALISAAVAGAALPTHAAQPETPGDSAEPAKTPDEARPEVLVVYGTETQGLKAQSQTSANKFPLSLRETPQSVTVITQESLQDRQVTDLGQALEVSAGASSYSGTGPFGGMSSFGFNDVTIRGIAIDGYNDVREDGFVNNSYFTIPDMAIYDRVEVVKGPNSVTYGRGSVGGLINRVRKKPLADSQTNMELSVGSYEGYRFDFDTTGPLSSSKRTLGRIVAGYSDEGSFVDGVDARRAVVAPSLAINPRPTTSLLLEGLAQVDRFTNNPGMPLVARGDGRYQAPDIPRSMFVGVPTKDGSDWSIYSAALQLDQSLNDRWLATLRLSGNKTHNKMHDDRYAYGFYDAYTTMNASAFDIGNTIWSGELRMSGDLPIGRRTLKLVAGMEFNDNDYHRRGAYAYLGTANIYQGNFADAPSQPLTDDYQFGGTDKNQGYYVQAQIRPVDRLSILAGLRYDRTDSSFSSETSGASMRKKDDAVTGRIGATYDLTQHISVYGMYGESFLPQLFSIDQNGDPLDPETGTINEVGVKTEWLDGRLGISSAAYRVDREHIPVGVPVPPGETPYSISSGLQRSQGMEIEINGEPVRGWQMSFAYNALDSTFKDPSDPLYGSKPGGSADWQYTVYSSYELQSGVLRGLGVGATVFSIPDRGLSTFQGGTLDGYTRYDLHFFYKGLPNVELQLLLRNLQDERYIEGADRLGALAQFGSPRAALLSVRYKR